MPVDELPEIYLWGEASLNRAPQLRNRRGVILHDLSGSTRNSVEKTHLSHQPITVPVLTMRHWDYAAQVPFPSFCIYIRCITRTCKGMMQYAFRNCLQLFEAHRRICSLYSYAARI